METAVYQLIGAPHSYFTAKARCYFLCKGIPFTEVLSTRKVFKKVIMSRTGLRFIPVVLTPEDNVLQDTTVIIETLEARFPQPSILPSDPSLQMVCLLMELFADDWILPHAMHYRWNFPKSNAKYLRQMFGKTILPRTPAPIRYFAVKKVLQRFGTFAPLLGVNAETIPALEEQLKDILGWFECHFEQHSYVLGGRPTLADVALTGPFHGHLAIDPYPKQMLEEHYPHLMAWVARMRQPGPISGELVESVPDTIVPFLKLAFKAQWPNLELIESRLVEWLNLHPGQAIPRSVGKGKYHIGETLGEKVLQPYLVWRRQRILDFYAECDQPAKASLDGLLTSLGGLESFQLKPGVRLSKEGNRLVIEKQN